MPRRSSTLGVDSVGESWFVEVIQSNPFDLAEFKAWPSRVRRPFSTVEFAYAYVMVTDEEATRRTDWASLEDIVVVSGWENRGVGSLLLRYIEGWCRGKAHSGVRGDLSAVDLGHMDKLKHFYTKNGFTFILNPPGDTTKRFMGTISKTFEPN